VAGTCIFGQPPASTCPDPVTGVNCDDTQENNGYIVSVASGTTNPGGCIDGVTEYQFLRNGEIARDFTANAIFLDAPTSFASYEVIARCSTDEHCVSDPVGAEVAVYSGDGGDVIFGEKSSPFDPSSGIVHSLAAGTTTLAWWAPPPLPGAGAAVDIYRGSILAAGGTGGLTAVNAWNLAGGACLNQPPILGDYVGAPVPATPGYNDSVALTAAQDPIPALGTVTYYVVTKDNPPQSPTPSPNSHGCANPAQCGAGPNAGVSCSSDSQCGGARCLNVNIAVQSGLSLGAFGSVNSNQPFGCLGPSSPYKVIRQTPAVCP
jgi:hypothetical protein